MGELLSLLIVLLVIAVVVFLIAKYVVPLVPHPWGGIILAIFIVIICLFLLQRFGVLSL